MSQKSGVLQLVIKAQLHSPATASKTTLYQSGHPIHSVPDIDMTIHKRQVLNKTYKSTFVPLPCLATKRDLTLPLSPISSHNITTSAPLATSVSQNMLFATSKAPQI